MVMFGKQRTTAGWSKPLKVRYQFHLPELMNAIRKYTPVGTHTHDQISGSYSKAGFPRRSGRLKKAVSTLSNYRANKDGVKINLGLPYSIMVEVGGFVKAVSGKLMAWRQGGQDIQKRSRRGYTIKGARYLRQGYSDWVGGGRGITPKWE